LDNFQIWFARRRGEIVQNMLRTLDAPVSATMPSLSRNVVHDYDPKSVFHNQAINIPLLTNWIDELVSLTEKSLPVRNTPTTEQLVESLQRYDAVFRELMRQTGKYSVNITRMFAKTWTGTLNLMDYMVKSYHRYVTTTDHLQEQARQLLKQRAAQVASTALQKEEFVLERTALRAQIRTLQAEVHDPRSIPAPVPVPVSVPVPAPVPLPLPLTHPNFSTPPLI
jgi:hypothetical protein